ncbi:lipase family protein [Psychroserpens luteolus]|uniref:lipase family protein n=1 Tax=Psychroserpens luteolus TaxID=2855840 RepID=UPI001E4F9E3A|nr:lipase family protein [Psychroserpens luteolus]MCD2258854.1 lipase family protein [Psychroserpens luteolus]
MATIDHCRLLCASASAYLIETSFPNGVYRKDLRPKPTKNPDNHNTINQYNAIKLLSDPFVVVASPLKPNEFLKIEACFIGETAEGIIISFRGTLPPIPPTAQSIADWIQNIFYANTVPYITGYPGKVHEGFLDALLSLETGILYALSQLDPRKEKPIYLTGHSKGGAMAPIAALYFKNKSLFTANHVVTFAGPKPGDAVFASNYDAAFPNSTNFENYLDLVPFLAPGKTFIELLEKFPLLPEIIKELLEKAAQWDYEPVGTKNVQFINKHGVIDNSFPASNPILRFGEILLELTKGKQGLIQVGDAHHVSCGYRYMKGVCGSSNVCTF